MAKQATLTTITAGFTSASKINANFAALNTQFDNTVSRDGSTPNTMLADFDMNSNDILNAGDIFALDIIIDGLSLIAQVAAAAASATAAATSETNAATSAAAAQQSADDAAVSVTFLSHTDTPSTYSGQGGKFAKVNVGETALEFASSTGTEPSDGDKGDITVTGSGLTWSLDAGVVAATELATDAVETAKIKDVNVTTGKLANLAVTTGKLADNGVTLDKLEHGTTGDILYYGASGEPFRLAKGSDAEVLTLASGLPSWAAAAGAVTTVIKASDQSISSDSTLNDDNDLVFAMDANTTYWVELYMLYSQTNSTPELKMGWTVPSGCDLFWDREWATFQDIDTESDTKVANTTSGDQATTLRMMFRNGANAGNAQFRWAQDTSHASTTKVKKHSFMLIRSLGAT